MPDQIKVVIASSQRFKRKLILISLITLGITIYALFYFKIVPQSKSSSQAPQATNLNKNQISSQAALDNCDVTKEGNPLVRSLTKDSGIISGTFVGRILDLTQNKAKDSMKITLASIDFRQKYTFNILNRPGLIYDSKTLKLTDKSVLQTNQNIVITFSCSPNQGNSLKFDQISILKD